MRRPGSTRWVFASVCSPPAVITPGSVQPGNATGRSCAPAATTVRGVTTADAGSPSVTSTLVGPSTATTLVRRRTSTPAPSRDSITARPWRNCRSIADGSVTVNPGPGCL